MNLLACKVSNANVYVNGVDLLGRAEEVEFPQLKHKMQEHKGLGMAGSAEFEAGMGKLEAKITWASVYGDVAPAVFNGLAPAAIMIRGYQQEFSSGGAVNELPVVAMLSGVFKESPKLSVKHQESQSAESALSVYSYQLLIGGITQLQIDVLANIYIVQGIDVLANFRQILGG